MPPENLRELREKKGITLDEASESLKIGKLYLNSIERGDYDSLPQPVFSKGYIRSYCDFLGVDFKETLEDYNDYVSGKEPLKLESVQEIPELTIRNKRAKKIFAIVLSATFFLGIIIYFIGHQIRSEKEKLAESGKLQAELAHNASDFSRKDKNVNTKEEGKIKTEVAPLKPAIKREPPPVKEMAKEVKMGLTLNLEATELTWLYVVPDNGELVDVTLYPGDSLKVSAKESIKLKIGNAGGVVATLNGQNLGPLGKPGEVIEKTLTRGEGE